MESGRIRKGCLMEKEFNKKLEFSNGRKITVTGYPDDGSCDGCCVTITGGMKGNGMMISNEDAILFAATIAEAAAFSQSTVPE